jgi:hypothetical protein
MSSIDYFVPDSGTTDFEQDLRRVLSERAPGPAPAVLRMSVRSVVTERRGIRGRIRLAFVPAHAERRRSHSASFAAMSLAIVVIVVVAVSVTLSKGPGRDDQSQGQTRVVLGPSKTPFAASERPPSSTAVDATTRPTATPRSRVTPTPPVAPDEATCRPVGPVLPWRDRPNPLDPGQPLADAALHGMPAKQAAQLLRARNYCYTFRISSETWCVPPNGTVRDLAYGPAGELIVWVRPYPMKIFDPNKLPASGC